MKKRISLEQINKKCELLESLGFEVSHQDSNVSIDGIDNITFDFSATNAEPSDIIKTAILQTIKVSKENGQKELVNKFSDILKPLLS